MTSVNDSLHAAVEQVISISDSAQLDAEILLAFVLQCTRSFLRAWPEKDLTSAQLSLYEQLIQRRLQGEPIAYIVGHKEFWSLDLQVTPDTLIPRADTECIVNCVLEKFSAGTTLQIADLGTGSGAIALALAKERPLWNIIATDIKAEALRIAQANANKLQIKNIQFVQGNWCEGLGTFGTFDVIVSNPPYIALDDPHLTIGDVKFEPRTALVSGTDGLDDIRDIISQASEYLREGGWLFLEHGYNQSQAVQGLLNKAGYTNIVNVLDLSGQQRVTSAKFSNK
jgi:release factor glutamine methyltransferase